MVKWLRSLFAWRPYRHTGVWRYDENAVTGQRRALKVGACYQPLMLGWLRDGDKIIDQHGVLVIGSREWMARW